MLSLAAEAVCVRLTAGANVPPIRMAAFQQARLIAAALVPGFWLLFSLTYARGNAQEFLTRWKIGLVGAFAVPIGLATAGYRSLIVAVQIGGPHNLPAFGLGWSGISLSLVLLAAAVLILWNLERTYRASVGTMRWRIKYMLMAVGLIFVIRIYTSSQAILFRSVSLQWEILGSGTLIVASLLGVRSLLRVGEMELDVHPSHSMLQGSITTLLAGIYLLIVGVAARLFVRIGRGRLIALESLWILVAVVIFVLLLQSDRLRMRLGRFVSRHFQRPLYDYRTVWRRFTEGTASQVEEGELCRSLVKLTADIFQCLSVAIWIVEENDRILRLGGSTFLSEADGRNLALEPHKAATVIGYFERHPEPLDVEHSREKIAEWLKNAHPSEFPKKENRVCLPMIARGQVIALLSLGDRVGGTPFSAQDLDMLKCVGDHATASLLNVRLAQNLLKAKELEAFQTMAAFFVHDLKNAASTLSLMLKNLPVHFEDPAFREDALRGMGKSVAHINHMIGRLSLLRHELKIQPVDSDLNTLVNNALSGLESEPGFSVVRELGPLPKLGLDQDQISKVITNLILNAKEATAGSGQVRVSTAQEDGWVVLRVTDTGCGMTREFIERSLFRPFQTTKKNGLGIGMFQSKMIVEVHGGRIAVSSEPGVGTTFQVYLPAQR